MRSGFLPRLIMFISLLAFACNLPFLSGRSGGGGGGLTAIANAPGLLAPASYAETARALAAAVAELNRAQAQTIEHLRSSPSPESVDGDFLQVSAAAMTVAQLAEQLAASAANQAGGGEEADKAARPYLAAAQVGYFIVIETQNLREDYKAGGASAEQVSDKIAEAGGMLWSADEFDPSVNPQPFADARVNPASAPPALLLPQDGAESIRKQIDDSSGKGTTLSAWSASAGATRTESVTVPAPRSLAAGNVLDPEALNQMRTPEGQADADVVRAAASAKLRTLGAVGAAGGTGLEITVPAALVFQSEFGSRAMPYYPDGTGSATATADAGGPLVSAVTVQDGRPVAEPPIEVTSDTPLITLEIAEAVTSTTGDNSRGVALTVRWTTTLADPNFTLACTSGSGGTVATQASGASGEAGLALMFSRLQDTAVCQAMLAPAGPPMGVSPVIVLEADPSFVPTPAQGEPPTPAPLATPTAGERGAEPTLEPSPAPVEAGPPPGTSNWSIGFGAATLSGCPDVPFTIPIEGSSATMTTDPSGNSFTMVTPEGESVVFTGDGAGNYSWSQEQAVMTVHFTSQDHAEGTYSGSAEGCTITWPVSMDRTG